MNKYNTRQKYGQGWFLEPTRHSLARRGISTGRKSYAKDISLSDRITYEPVTITPPREEEVMRDADTVVAESEEKRVIEPVDELEYEPETAEPKTSEEVFEPEISSEISIEDELSELEASEQPVNVLQKTWKDRIKEYLKSGLQAYRDTNVSGIQKHISNIEEEEINIKDRVMLLNELKQKIMSKEHRDDVGFSQQLRQVNRINKLLSEPQRHLNTINSTVSMLNKRVEILTIPSRTGERKEGVVKEIYSSVFPSFGELMNPERLRSERPRERLVRTESRLKPIYRTEEKKKERLNVFPSFDEILHPEKL